MAPPVGAGDPQRPDHCSGAVQAARLGSFLGLELGREGSCSILPQDHDPVTQVPSPAPAWTSVMPQHRQKCPALPGPLSQTPSTQD